MADTYSPSDWQLLVAAAVGGRLRDAERELSNCEDEVARWTARQARAAERVRELDAEHRVEIARLRELFAAEHGEGGDRG